MMRVAPMAIENNSASVASVALGGARRWKIGDIVGFQVREVQGALRSDCWFVLKVRSGSEEHVADRLRREGQIAYVPMARRIFRRNRMAAAKAETIWRPAFVGYVFWGVVGFADLSVFRRIPALLGALTSGFDDAGCPKMVRLPMSEIIRIGEENDRSRFDVTRDKTKELRVLAVGETVMVEVAGMRLKATITNATLPHGDVEIAVDGWKREVKTARKSVRAIGDPTEDDAA